MVKQLRRSASRSLFIRSCRPLKRLDFLFHFVGKRLSGNFQVITGLKVDPELRGGSEISAESQGRIGGNTPFLQDDFVDPAGSGALGVMERWGSGLRCCVVFQGCSYFVHHRREFWGGTGFAGHALYAGAERADVAVKHAPHLTDGYVGKLRDRPRLSGCGLR